MTTSELEDDTLQIETVECGPHELVVGLKDGRRMVAPLWWLPRLQNSTPEQRSRWEIMPFGDAIEWPEIDEHVSVKGLLRGRPSRNAVAPTEGEQRNDQDGHGNINVQVQGRDNTIVIGAHRLTLTRHEALADDQSDIGLLTPYTRSIPLIGRERELVDLAAWLASDRPTSVRVLTGGAGVGKTRLALELVHSAKGWCAGFVRQNQLTRIGHGDAPTAPAKPVLAVIDYAAVHAEPLNAWLEELADPPTDVQQPKFRLLLLERQAEPGTGWWDKAFGLGGASARAVRRLLDPERPVPLRPLRSTGDRRAVFEAMVKRKDDTATTPDDPAFERRLDDAELKWGGDPLFLMMAGLKAAESGLPELLALSRTDLGIELAEREIGRIKRIAKARGAHERLLAVLAGYVTLCRGLPPEALPEVIEAEKAALGIPSAGDPGDIVPILAETLPGEGGRIGPIVPDMIGEAVTLEAFESYSDQGAGAVVRAFVLFGPPVVATVIRTIQDFSDRQQVGIAWLDALLDRPILRLGELVACAAALPPSSLSIDPRAVVVFEQLASLFRAMASEGGADAQHGLAWSLTSLGQKLIALHEFERAEGPLREAVEIRRALAFTDSSDALQEGLAVSLNNPSVCLDRLDKHEQALQAAEESVCIRCELFDSKRVETVHRLANGLRTLANRRLSCELYRQAAEAAQAAVNHHEEASELDRSAYAGSLNVLAQCLLHTDQKEKALECAMRGFRLRSELAHENPDAYRRDVLHSWKTLNYCFIKLSRLGDAASTAAEAVALLCELSAVTPAAFGEDLRTPSIF